MTDQTKPKKKHRGGWLKNPKLARKGETIGGGYWVFRRGDDTGRIRPPMWPFEYGALTDAINQANKLAEDNPGEEFIVVSQAYRTAPAGYAIGESAA